MTTASAPRCTACRRRLKRPTTSGLGPVCEKRLRPARPQPGSTPSTTPIPVIDGQTELPLPEHQPTLWSIK